MEWSETARISSFKNGVKYKLKFSFEQKLIVKLSTPFGVKSCEILDKPSPFVA